VDASPPGYPAATKWRGRRDGLRVCTIIIVGAANVGPYLALVIGAFFAASTRRVNISLIAVLGALAGALGGIVSGAFTPIVTAGVQDRQNTGKLRDWVSARALQLTRLEPRLYEIETDEGSSLEDLLQERATRSCKP
jgi:hypothetical protein